MKKWSVLFVKTALHRRIRSGAYPVAITTIRTALCPGWAFEIHARFAGMSCPRMILIMKGASVKGLQVVSQAIQRSGLSNLCEMFI
ncbi:unnamed protein product [Prunus armeniaca]|uniref:Uncharacterized protein n=1 Tax=Prunus armeniaca TaxID=36596 RepID=A0A6J5UEH4_PRUAR|nr:unnamed protein product [Prunus armeniaca]